MITTEINVFSNIWVQILILHTWKSRIYIYIVLSWKLLHIHKFFLPQKNRNRDRLLIITCSLIGWLSTTPTQWKIWAPGSSPNWKSKLRWWSVFYYCPYWIQYELISSRKWYGKNNYNRHCRGSWLYCGLCCIIFSPKTKKWYRI